jgi:hypothetical protein
MRVDSDPEPSNTAIVTALFGWSLALPSPPSERKRTLSLSRIGSLSRPTSPSLSRASSVSRGTQWGRGDSLSPMPSSPLISISHPVGGTPMRARTPWLSLPGRIIPTKSSIEHMLHVRRVLGIPRIFSAWSRHCEGKQSPFSATVQLLTR